MPQRITVNAPAKVNFYLDVTGKRDDGYHNIETVMQTIDIHDTLTFSKAMHKEIRISFVGGNRFNITSGEKNLIHKAAMALGVWGVDVSLTKKIPTEAGLGGGSSDAASTLIALNELFALGRSREELAAIAAGIGADVPFFIYGGAAAARGIGEIIEPLEPVTDWEILIEKPEKGLSTKEIYRLMDEEERAEGHSLDEFLLHFRNSDPELPKYIFNAMENVSVRLCPEIEEAKKKLLDKGCEAAMMSGSGSAVFGLRKK